MSDLMRSSTRAGRECLALLALTATLLSAGCQWTASNTTLTATPVPTPIVVGETPDPTVSPTPTQVVDEGAEREETLRQVRSAIEKTREEFPGDTGIVFVDIDSDQSLEFDSGQRFESASLMKLVVIAELYRLIQVGELDLDHPLVLEAQHIVGGSGDLKDLEPGITFPVRILAEKMITQSDNTATQMLTDFLTKEALNKSTTNLGMTGTTINRDVYDFAAIDQGRDNYITAKDAAVLLEQIARQELPGSQEIHNTLERQQRNDMIGKQLPEGTRVAHKTGELNGILHDAGIVYAPKGAFVLVMLSDKVRDKKQGVALFAKLSQEIFALYQDSTPSPSPTPATR